tara:strand:- start:2358 stop:2624 length:267 start_codon:yes stop_codon:yes gene_type:complete
LEAIERIEEYKSKYDERGHNNFDTLSELRTTSQSANKDMLSQYSRTSSLLEKFVDRNHSNNAKTGEAYPKRLNSIENMRNTDDLTFVT